MSDLLANVKAEDFFEHLKVIVRAAVKMELRGGYKEDLDDKLLSSTEVRKLFNPELSKDTLYRWEKDGLKFKWVRGRKFYRRGDVEEATRGKKREMNPEVKIIK